MPDTGFARRRAVRAGVLTPRDAPNSVDAYRSGLPWLRTAPRGRIRIDGREPAVPEREPAVPEPPSGTGSIVPLPADLLGSARHLLEQAGLPLAGTEDPATELYAALDGRRLCGLVGIEVRPPSALLRSLVVAPELRGRGLGQALLAFAEGAARERGLTTAFGLTTTIPELLERAGYSELPQRDLPAELRASAELQGACPASARAFRKPLG